MSCGAPVIASNTSSIPEIVQMQEALFDPHNVEDLVTMIIKTVKDISFRKRLLSNSLTREKLFSWEFTAKRALSALESVYKIQQNTWEV